MRSPVTSPSARRKGYASPIFAIVPDHNESLSRREHSNPITPTASPLPARREQRARSPGSLFSRTSSASTPSLLRSCSPAVQNMAPTAEQPRSRSAFGRSINDLWPTDPRSRSHSVASPRPFSPGRTASRREMAREIIQQVKNSSARNSPDQSRNTQRAANKSKSEMPSRLPRRQETATLSSTTTVTRKSGAGDVVSRSLSTTSVTISRNMDKSRTPTPVIDKNAISKSVVNGFHKSAIGKSEPTLSRTKVQLLVNEDGEDETVARHRQLLRDRKESRRTPSPTRQVKIKEIKTVSTPVPAITTTAAPKAPQHTKGRKPLETNWNFSRGKSDFLTKGAGLRASRREDANSQMEVSKTTRAAGLSTARERISTRVDLESGSIRRTPLHEETGGGRRQDNWSRVSHVRPASAPGQTHVKVLLFHIILSAVLFSCLIHCPIHFFVMLSHPCMTVCDCQMMFPVEHTRPF